MDGVILTPLKQIEQQKGTVLHAMKKTDEGYAGFGEAYFSTVSCGEVKGWKMHTRMTLNLVVPLGEIQFVIVDERPSSSAKGEFLSVTLSVHNYQRLTISPGLWVGFKGRGENQNMLLNLASIEHDPLEAKNLALDCFSFDWSRF